MFKKKYHLYSALFELTLKCNMRCIHCGSSAGTQREKELTKDEWKRVIDELSDMGCNVITILGGEPLVHPDWYEISKYVKESDLKLTLISNGLLVNDKNISKIEELNPDTMAISLDGGKAETHDYIRQVKGSHKKALEAIDMLRERNIDTTAITTLSRINFEELPLIRDTLLNKNVAWQIQIASIVGRFKEEQMLTKEEFYASGLFIASSREKYSYKELPIMGAHCFGYNSKVLPNVNIAPWKGCPAGMYAIGIQSDGGVKGCLSLDDSFKEGNIRKSSLSEIWNHPDFADYNRKFKVEDLNGDCKDCKYGKKCRGGCLSVSTSVTGKKHADPYCYHLIEKEEKMK